MWYRTAEKAKQFVSVCIIFRKNKNNTEVLLVKRADNKWCIPGGHLENKEKSLDELKKLLDFESDSEDCLPLKAGHTPSNEDEDVIPF